MLDKKNSNSQMVVDQINELRDLKCAELTIPLAPLFGRCGLATPHRKGRALICHLSIYFNLHDGRDSIYCIRIVFAKV
jgi:hypothetical protein